MWTHLRLRFAALVRRTRFERELADELAFHIQARAEEWERRGLSPSAARRRARIELGSSERIKEEVRDVRLGRWLEVLRQDLRYGFRVLRAHPGITAIGVVSLAFGMAVCIYSFPRVHADFLAPLPGARDPDSLVAVDARLSYPAFERIRELDGIVEGATAYLGPVPFSVAVDGEPGAERVFGHLVSPEYFEALGVAPAAGRLLSPETERARSEPAVVVSERFWRSRLDADPRAVGSTLQVNGRSATLAGIAGGGIPGRLPGESGGDLRTGSCRRRARAGAGRGHSVGRRGRAVPGGRATGARGVDADGRSGARHGGAGAGRAAARRRRAPPRGPAVAAVLGGPRRSNRTDAVAAHARSHRAARRARADAGLREPGRPAVGARRRAAPRDGGPLRAGRRPLAAGPAVADRERAAGSGRRRGGVVLLPLAAARHRIDQPGEPIPYRDERQLRSDSLALRHGDRRGDRDRARTRAGLRGDPRRARRHCPVRAAKADGAVAPLSPVRCQEPVRHVPGGRGPHAAAHHRPVGRRLPAVQRYRPRVRHRQFDTVRRGSGA